MCKNNVPIRRILLSALFPALRLKIILRNCFSCWLFNKIHTKDGNKVLIKKKSSVKSCQVYIKHHEGQVLFDHCENNDQLFRPGKDIFSFKFLKSVTKLCFNLGSYSSSCFHEIISRLLFRGLCLERTILVKKYSS